MSLSNNNYLARWDDGHTTLVDAMIVDDGSVVSILTAAAVASNLDVRGTLSIWTNDLRVMGTNILYTWIHTNIVTNLNADMVDGWHATNLMYAITTNVYTNVPLYEKDPRVKIRDNNYVPKWSAASNGLITGTIYDDGNIGIGTANPRGHFDVDGPGNIWLTDDGLQSGIQTLYLPGHIYMAPYANSDIVYLQARRTNNSGTTALQLRTYNNGTLTEAVRISGDGKIGIGTTGPVYKLDVTGDIRATGVIYADANGAKYFDGGDDAALWDVNVANTIGIYGQQNSTQGHIKLGSSGPTISGVGGNVGIGTTSPGAQLHVVGGTQALISRGTGNMFMEHWLDGNDALLMWGDNDGVLADLRLGSATAENAAGFQEFVRIKSTGNVGIGISPAYKLDVNGPAVIRGPLGLSGGDYRIQTLDGSQFLALRSSGNDTALVPAYYGFRVTNWENSKNYLISDFYGNLKVPYGLLYEGSDSRTKLDQEPLDYGLTEILKLEPKRYSRTNSIVNLKAGGQKNEGEKGESEIGLIAQEVYEVIPEAVALPDEGQKTWGLSYSSLVPVLIKAVQEQQEQIEELKDKITRLEKKNTK